MTITNYDISSFAQPLVFSIYLSRRQISGFLITPCVLVRIEPQKSVEHLESLANKGLVFAHEKNGIKGYAPLNSIQVFENPYRKGIYDETIKKLTPLWKKYRATSLPSLGGETTSILRVISISNFR